MDFTDYTATGTQSNRSGPPPTSRGGGGAAGEAPGGAPGGATVIPASLAASDPSEIVHRITAPDAIVLLFDGRKETVPYKDLHMLLSIIEGKYMLAGKAPTLDEVLIQCQDKIPLGRIQKILDSQALRERLILRGIMWTGVRGESARFQNTLTPQQIMAVQIVTDPTARGNLRDRLQAVGLTYGVYRNWLKTSEPFKEALSKVSEEMVKDNIATVHTSLVKKAETGDTGAMKLFYEVSGRHDPMRQQSLDMERVVGLLLEVITRYVTDIGTLTLINQDFGAILSGGTPAITSPDDLEPPVDAEIVAEPEAGNPPVGESFNL